MSGSSFESFLCEKKLAVPFSYGFFLTDGFARIAEEAYGMYALWEHRNSGTHGQPFVV